MSNMTSSYKAVFIASALITLSLFFIIMNSGSQNQAPTFFWAMTVWYMYKHDYQASVTLQKIMMGFSGLATMAFAIGSFQEDKTISNLLGFSPYEMIIPGLISFFVHFWLLGFFQKRLSLDSDLKNYVGQYKDGKYDGQGTLTLADGRKYVGQFKDGKFDGQGTYTWPSGNKYVGQYKDGKYDGQGTYTWPDGNKYVGQWKDGKKNGQGTYTWPDGQKYVGQYKDGKKVSASYIDPMDDNVTSEGGDKVRDSQQIGFDISEMASEEYDNNRNTGIWAMAFA